MKISCCRNVLQLHCRGFYFLFEMEILWFVQDDNLKLKRLWFSSEICLQVSLFKLKIICFSCKKSNILFLKIRKLWCRLKNILFLVSHQTFDVYNLFRCMQPPPHAEIPFGRFVRQAVDHLGGILILYLNKNCRVVLEGPVDMIKYYTLFFLLIHY